MPVIKQVGGTHYSAAEGKCPHCNGVIQHWDVAANLPGLEYAATKYIWRHAAKAGFEDLKKAISYVEKRMAIDYPAEYAEWKEPKQAKDEQPGYKPCPACTCHSDACVHASDCPWSLWMFPPKDKESARPSAAPAARESLSICCLWCGAPPGYPCDTSQVHPTP